MDSFGPGVSRVLQSSATQYLKTIWQQGKPPTDSELNLIQQLASEETQASILRSMPSGFLGNETNPQRDFVTHPSWSNHFRFGPQRPGEVSPIVWAHVNGWLIPVAGTKTGAPPGSANNTDYSNVIALDPPPGAAGDARIDFVFLEVWKARIQPNPSTVNKPLAGGIYKYGNVETGFDFLPDDLVDPAIGFETTQRVQIQYRIRVVKGLVSFTSNPDGFDPVVVKAQGAAVVPTSFTFTNMRQELGDPGLWRAGDGTQNALATVDGYSYAIPIAAVFRRNTTAWNGNPSQNLNGGFNRNPTAVDRTAFKVFSGTPVLSAAVSATATSLPLASIADLPLPATPATPVLIKVRDELMTYSGFADNSLLVSRGVNVDTIPQSHPAGTVVELMSGRPDGLFADQVASTDILDLRHLVNPNGFDYRALLKSNLDKLLRGQLRANWKLSGAGPRGTYVHYQDLIGMGSALSLGITRLDAPDNIRMVFSDAAVVQPVEIVCRPRPTSPGTGPVSPISVRVDWTLGLNVNTTRQVTNSRFSAGDTLVLPVAQLREGIPTAIDQVRWLNDATGDVRIRLAGETDDLPTSMYSVTPLHPGPDDDLTITFAGSFAGTATNRNLYIRAHVVYGPGRGLSRRPDVVHSISYLSTSPQLLTQQWGVPRSNKGARVQWAALWSKYRKEAINGLLPSTTETYVDPGSKTVVLAPFRRIDFPETVTIDGRGANYACPHDANGNPIRIAGSPTAGTITANGKTITVSSISGVAVGNALVVVSGAGQGRYTVAESPSGNTITVDRPIRAPAGTITFAIYVAQGCMPLLTPTGQPKWTQTDPLGLFCGTRASSTGPETAALESIYVSLPRHLVPGWGELAVPILPSDTDVFASGINFMVRTGGASVLDGQKNYAAYYGGGGGNKQFATFSQTLAYNTAGTLSTVHCAGIRFFADARGLNRKGLEFPPFYGIARLMGVYQASDYAANLSPFGDNREPSNASVTVNLLRQAMGPDDGPVLWIETDDDGDSTFILNANAIDISRAPTPIAKFEDGTYVVDAVVFGFDRGTFDLNRECRLVLTRPGDSSAGSRFGWTKVDGTVSFSDRADNVNQPVAGLAAVLPGPASPADQVVINYSRTVYQGDPWGSQTGYMDLAYSPGPISSEHAYQVARISANDPAEPSRPNQKVLEILASTTFTTDLGTGRFSGDTTETAFDFRNVAYEDQSPAVFPPATSGASRPRSLPSAFVAADVVTVNPEYLGCTEQLPLGALFRDKDFRGQAFGSVLSTLIYSDTVGIGSSFGAFADRATEVYAVPIGSASISAASPGDLLVHVDGEQNTTNYALLTNYRTFRGGSVFVASGVNPGGILSLRTQSALAKSDRVNVLHGCAMLVRNAATNLGVSEVSAGDELMLLIVTTGQCAPGQAPGLIQIGTNGVGEGYSAAELYRIEGHPLIRNHTRLLLDPSSIVLRRS